MIAFQWPTIRPFLGLPDYRGCDSRGYDDDHYLAFCGNSYGAYDSGAIYLDLESAQRSIRAADVIILGNSRAVFGFSTEATGRFFARLGIPFYMLAFQHDERYRFPLAIMKAARARPKAVIIEADSFFDGKLSRPAQEAMGPNGTAHARYRQLLQRVHRALCEWRNLPDRWRADYCEGHVMTVFRSRRDGRWLSYGLPATRYPVDPFSGGSGLADERQAVLATSFRKAIGIPAECVILTEAPREHPTNLGHLDDLSRRTGMPVVTAFVDGLTTFDHIHLDQDGAEKWSARFLSDVQPILQACLQRRQS